MKIAIHQPNFMPWMGYFFKIARCDAFVFYDNAEYTQKSFIRRVLIHKEDPSDELFLTVPLKKHSSFNKISELQITENLLWQGKIIAQLHQAYHKSPFYNNVEQIIDEFFRKSPSSSSLADYNSEIIKYISEDVLGLHPRWIKSSDLHIKSSKTNAVIEMINQLNGTEYISGLGAKKYHKPELFYENNIKLSYPDFPSYFDQIVVNPTFKYKSILSYLANYSIDEVKSILIEKD